MNGSEASEYQQEMDEREHQRAEVEQEALFYSDDIYVSIKDICNCSRCRDLRWGEAERR